MGENIHKIVHQPAYQLACHIKKSLDKYNTTLEHFCTEHKVIPKLHAVYARSMTVLSPAQQQSMELLEKLREAGILYTKKKYCCLTHNGGSGLVSRFPKGRDRLEVWNLVVCFREGKKINPSRIHRVAKNDRI